MQQDKNIYKNRQEKETTIYLIDYFVKQFCEHVMQFRKSANNFLQIVCLKWIN